MFSRRQPKILVLCPVYNSERTLPRWIENAKKWRGVFEFVFAENNSTDNTLQLIKNSGLPHKLIRVWFKDDPFHEADGDVFDPIGHIRQLLLTYARNRNADYAVFVDSDVYPTQPGFIQRLLKCRGDIVGAGYIRFFESGAPALTAIFPDNSRRLILPKKSVKVIGLGMGCTIISKKVLLDHSLEFWPLRKNHSEDFSYTHNASDKGYSVVLDVSMEVEHDMGIATAKPWNTATPNFNYRDSNYYFIQ